MMAAETPGRTRALRLFALAIGLIGCSGSVPASLLLTIVSGDGAPAPDHVRLRVFDRHGSAHQMTAFPAPAVAAGGRLGTVVVYPRPGGSLDLRLQAHGLQGEAMVSEGTLAVTLSAGSQRETEIVLAASAAPVDNDADGVTDAIDNCAGMANPEQADSDGDGVGDGCSPADAGAGDGPASDGPADGGQPSDGGDGQDGGLLGLGAACDAPARCQSGFCVDGVCCDSACDGTCQACNLATGAGRCGPVAEGQPEPHGRCTAQTPDTCGRDGTCDGAGACRKFPAGTVCRAASCESDSERNLPATCDGEGACRAPVRQPCVPYVCAGGACKTSCAGAEDCSAGNPCVNLSCGKSPLGTGCTSGDTCNSGNCVDGVCCDVASCAGPCRACNLPGAAGSCQTFPANAEPRAAGCPAEAATTCGRTGRCDGSGGCQLHATGTPCLGGSCAAGTETPPATCNGDGVCTGTTPRTCGNYICQGDACGTTCGGDGDCAASAFCDGIVCSPLRASGAACTEARQCSSDTCLDSHCCQVPACGPGQTCTGAGGTCIDKQALGSSCTQGDQCASGFCTDGVCCNVACTETCRQCDGSTPGTCETITNKIDLNAMPPCRCNASGVCP